MEHKTSLPLHIVKRGLFPNGSIAAPNSPMTAEVKKAKYVKGKCTFRTLKEEVLARQFGEVLKNIYVPDQVQKDVVASLRSNEDKSVAERREALFENGGSASR